MSVPTETDAAGRASQRTRKLPNSPPHSTHSDAGGPVASHRGAFYLYRDCSQSPAQFWCDECKPPLIVASISFRAARDRDRARDFGQLVLGAMARHIHRDEVAR